MACTDVGSANPDIAGLGIILSFIIQAGLSFFLSGWSILVETRLRLRELRRTREDIHGSKKKAENTTTLLLLGMLRKPADDISLEGTRHYANHKIELIDRALRTIGDAQLLNGQPNTSRSSATFDANRMCPGISLLIGALAQHETLGLYHFHIVYDVVNFTG
ncbi:hypothetical protein PG994_009875 [Apiospora phragmitis]|uniref:Uncharacterized protein n=1 Tax=Apiospora phragmitis TaxID=2905665 RepID=A0ABR1TNA7_9PEZI